MHTMNAARRHIVITVHGIRTFGKWQKRLKILLEQAEPDIIVLNYDYGFFSALAFLFPFLRWWETLRFRRTLKKILDDNPNALVDLVGHSFGTHLIAWSIKRLSARQPIKINSVILAGSVLSPRFHWNELISASIVTRVLNECGTKDFIVIMGQLFAFTGVAGYLGFRGVESNQFQNNWHPFGHSGYFQRDGIFYDDFMATRWLPLLTREMMPVQIDTRPDSTAFGVWVFVLPKLRPLTLLMYVWIFWGIFLWYRDVKITHDANLARSLASDSEELARKSPQALSESLRLAIRSVQTSHTPEGIIALRRAIELFPVVTASIRFQGAPTLVRFSASGKYLAMVWDQTIHIWSVEQHRDIQQLKLEAPVKAMRWIGSPVNWQLLVYTDNAELWSIGPSAVNRYRVSAPRAQSVAIGEKQGRPLLALVLDGFRVQFRSVQPDAILREVSHEQPTTVAFRDDGRAAATIGYDGLVSIWALDKSSLNVEPITHDEPISVVVFSHDGSEIAFGDNFGSVVIRDLKSGQERRMGPHQSAITSLSFSPNGDWLVSGSGDGTARLWDCHSGVEISRMTDEDVVNDVSFNDDGSQIAVSGRNLVRIWNFPTTLPLDPPGIVTALAISEDKGTVYIGDSYGNIDSVKLWPRPLVSSLIREVGQKLAVRALWSNNGVLRAAFEDGSIKSWSGNKLMTSQPVLDNAGYTNMTFSLDGKLLAAGDWDGSIRFVHTNGTAGPSLPLSGQNAIEALFFVGQGSTLAAEGNAVLDVWDISNAQRIGEWKIPSGHALTFTPNGDQLLIGKIDGASLWSQGQMSPNDRFDCYGSPTVALFFQDESYVVLGSGNKTERRVIVTPFNESTLIREGCKRLQVYDPHPIDICP